MDNLPIIQKTYDLIKWYVPILNKLPRNHKLLLGDRIITGLYEFLESLILARYAKEKLAQDCFRQIGNEGQSLFLGEQRFNLI